MSSRPVRRGLRILDVGDDYFHRVGGEWKWDWPFPVLATLALFERQATVEEFRFWGRIAPGDGVSAETKFPFPTAEKIEVIGARTSGRRGLTSHLLAVPQLLTRGLLAVWRADVVLFRWPSLHSMLLVPFASLFRKTFAIRLRVDIEDGLKAAGAVRSPFLASLAGRYTRWALKRCSVSVCISRFLREKYGNDRTIILNECSVMESDVSPSPAPPGRPLILYVGRLTSEKGVDVLLRAFSRVTTPALLEIVGAGSERSRLEELVRDLGISEGVRFAGGIADRTELVAKYRYATLFVLPSRSEGLGCVLLEAMSAGTPIVATNVGGIPELVRDGWNGFLVPPEDPSAMAGAIDRMLADGDLRALCAQRGVDVVREQTFEKQVGRWVELIVGAWRARTGATA